MGEVKGLTQYLSLPKGEDIRMVYSGILSGLNSYLWAPNFSLHTVGSTFREVERGNFMADRNIGEMFLNLMLSD